MVVCVGSRRIWVWGPSLIFLFPPFPPPHSSMPVYGKTQKREEKKGASVSNNIRRRRKCSRIWNFVVGVFCVWEVAACKYLQKMEERGGEGGSDFFLDCLPFCVVVEMAKNAFQDGGGMEVTPKKHPWVEKRKKGAQFGTKVWGGGRMGNRAKKNGG